MSAGVSGHATTQEWQWQSGQPTVRRIPLAIGTQARCWKDTWLLLARFACRLSQSQQEINAPNVIADQRKKPAAKGRAAIARRLWFQCVNNVGNIYYVRICVNQIQKLLLLIKLLLCGAIITAYMCRITYYFVIFYYFTFFSAAIVYELFSNTHFIVWLHWQSFLC